MENSTLKTLLLIADISGYTKFMVSSKTALSHSQVIISGLIESILEEIDLPLEVSKLEGDAVFFYGIDNGNLKEIINEKIEIFFESFHKKLNFLIETNICNCDACNNIHNLKLKLIIHYGDVHFYKVGKFDELSGPDVIIVHRLLKNLTDINQYILLSESAQNYLDFKSDHIMTKFQESYEGVGTIKTFVYNLEFNDKNLNTEKIKVTKFDIFKLNFKKMKASLFIKLKKKKI